MRVLLVNDTRTSENWGCRATTTVLMASLEAAGHDIVATVGLDLLDPPIRPLVDEWLGANRARARGKTASDLLTKAAGRIPQLDATPRTGAEVRALADATRAGDGRFATVVEALDRCDALVINGEGSLYDEQPKGLLLFVWIELARRASCSIHLVNHTMQVAAPSMRALAVEYGPQIDSILCRERTSVGVWADLGIEATFAADAAFAHRPADRDAIGAVHRRGYYDVWPDSARDFRPDRPYVCLGGSSVFQRADRGSVDPRADYRWLATQLRELCSQVVLIAPCQKDANLLRPIAVELGLPLIGAPTPTPQAVDLLGHAELLISGRWHPTILASTGGTPFVMIEGNTNKCQDLYDLFAVEDTIVAARDLHDRRQDLVDKAARHLADPSARSRVRGRADELRTSALENGRLRVG